MMSAAQALVIQRFRPDSRNPPDTGTAVVRIAAADRDAHRQRQLLKSFDALGMSRECRRVLNGEVLVARTASHPPRTVSLLIER
jgi:hypothetical protein